MANLVRTVVLLPGLDGTGRLFGPLKAELPRGWRAIVVSYPKDKILSVAQEDLPYKVSALMEPKTLAAMIIVGLLAGVLGASEPVRPDISLLPQDRILILSPHPDDDILGCAGVIQSALEKKLPVEVVYLTNGDNYEWAFLAYKKRPMLLPSEMRAMGLVRHKEAAAAEALLGVPESQLFFLGYPDWGTEHIFMEHWGKNRPVFRSMLTKVREVPYANAFRPGAPYKGESVLQDLEKIMTEFKPTKVFVAHPADAHRDHHTFYLFARVALWDVEDRLRPMVYPYLVHYPHWPEPRGLHPDRTLTPPNYFRELDWSEQKLSDAQIDRKRKALELHQSQMAKDRGYLESFLAKNELFSNFPDIVLGGQLPAAGALPLDENETTPAAISASSMTEAHWRTIYREGDDLSFRMDISTHSHFQHPVILYAFGYRSGRPFEEMPKLKIEVRGSHLTVLDQGQPVKESGILFRRLGQTLIIRVPLKTLGNPDRIIGTAWSRSAEPPFDWRIWRVIDLRGNPS